MKIRIIKKRWWTPPWGKADGITLYPFVFVRRGASETLLRHELIHIYQIQRDGWWRFYLGYLKRKYINQVSYLDDPMEVEAYKYENDIGFLPIELEVIVWEYIDYGLY